MEPTKKTGRPRSFSKDEALDVALGLFLEHGYEGCTLGMLTESLGLHKPSLYSAFGSKEALFLQVLRKYQNTYEVQFEEIVARELTPKETVNEMLKLVIRNQHCDSAGCLVVNSTTLVNQNHPEIAEEIRVIHNMNHTLLRSYLQQAFERGSFSGDVDATARFYHAVAHGLAVSYRTHRDADAQAQIVEMAMNAWPETS